jgi:thiamine-phosphate pyrophosphorylase
VPLVALGGIDAGNMSACLAAGAASVAVMGAVMRARRPGEVVAHLLQGSAATAPPTL